ncbi:MAG: hypothetical protein SGARI_001625, partial [Bacillariaceae sp.]
MRQYRRLLETTPDIQKFSIHGGGATSANDDNASPIDDEQVMELVTALSLYQGGEQSTIQEFSIDFFTFSEHGWNALRKVLCEELRFLKKLYLRQVFVKDEDGQVVPEYIPKDLLGVGYCLNLEELHLVNCHLNALAAQDLGRQMVLSNLKVLSLEGNSIGNVGVKCIAKALEETTSTLQALDIDRVGCSMDGMKALSESVAENATLQSLSCSGNGGLDILPRRNSNSSNEDKPASQTESTLHDHPFEDLLHVNTSIQKLQPTGITPKIDFYLKLNRAGRSLIGKNAIGKTLHLILERVNNDPDVMFFFLNAQSGTTMRSKWL